MDKEKYRESEKKDTERDIQNPQKSKDLRSDQFAKTPNMVLVDLYWEIPDINYKILRKIERHSEGKWQIYRERNRETE